MGQLSPLDLKKRIAVAEKVGEANVLPVGVGLKAEGTIALLARRVHLVHLWPKG